MAEVRSRSEAVLDTALAVFCRLGYRKTAMTDVADAAGISRPGLYFLFASKPQLFAAAVTRGVERDLATAAEALQGSAALSRRLLDAFDAWSGRYVGFPGTELGAVVGAHPDLVEPSVLRAPAQFRDLVASAIADGRRRWDAARVDAVTATLVSASIGVKAQAASRAEYREHLASAIALLVP